MTSITILWFKRDLRIHDHPALAVAADGSANAIPLFIVEPDGLAQPDASARQYRFVAECLESLRAACASLGAPLLVRVGETVEILEALRRTLGVARLVSHEETGNGWSYARDLRVAEWARMNGVEWIELAQSGVVRRLPGRDGWAARRTRFLRQPVETHSGGLWNSGLELGGIPSACELGMSPDRCPGRQPGGREAAQRLLNSFLTERGRNYRKAMSSPLEGATACSRLSPHLAFGTLSAREVAQQAARRKSRLPTARDGWAGAVRSFSSRLAWRDHFIQKLEDQPALEHACLHPAYEGLRPAEPDPVRLAAWCAGETGIPFVDACMRYLAHTGWLNFRMRAMLMAVASYHLWLDWRPTGLHLARQFTDYEPGIHWSQAQMQSGTTGMNTIRIYNPVKQGRDQDPQGVFTRRWVPELAGVPDRYLQEPWLWPEAGGLLGRRYPAPVVDVAAAAAAARDRVWAVRRGEGFRGEADLIIRKHGSRKGDAGFVNDRAPRRPRRASAPDERQLGFDF